MNEEIISKIDELVKEKLKNDKTGHDYAHTKRVLNNALKLLENYPEADKEILVVACLLHDIAYEDGPVRQHHLVGARKAEKILKNFNFPEEKIKKIFLAIEDHVGQTISPIRKNEELQIESKILRDADNIDALGENGLKRMIAFTKHQNIPDFISKEDGLDQSLYGNLKALLTWPEKMLTPEGKSLGRQCLQPIKEFMKQLEN